jgi:hypothetical protein
LSFDSLGLMSWTQYKRSIRIHFYTEWVYWVEIVGF